jgi:hypothetical protein
MLFRLGPVPGVLLLFCNVLSLDKGLVLANATAVRERFPPSPPPRIMQHDDNPECAPRRDCILQYLYAAMLFDSPVELYSARLCNRSLFASRVQHAASAVQLYNGALKAVLHQRFFTNGSAPTVRHQRYVTQPLPRERQQVVTCTLAQSVHVIPRWERRHGYTKAARSDHLMKTMAAYVRTHRLSQ